MYKEIDALIENTTFKARTDKDGEIMSYRIYPAEGYMLHEKSLDEPVMDEVTGIATGEVKKVYTKGFITAGYNYDFEKNEREIYAVAEIKK